MNVVRGRLRHFGFGVLAVGLIANSGCALDLTPADRSDGSEQSAQESGSAQVGSATAQSPAQPSSGNDDASAPQAQDSLVLSPSDTPVGQRVAELQERYNARHAQLTAAQERYRELQDSGLSAIADFRPRIVELRSRLQTGTTPGNPRLVSSWNEARAAVGEVRASADELEALNGRLASQAREIDSYLKRVADSFSLSGGIEGDHADLAVLQDTGRAMLGDLSSLRQKVSEAVASRRRFTEQSVDDLTELAEELRGPGRASAK